MHLKQQSWPSATMSIIKLFLFFFAFVTTSCFAQEDFKPKLGLIDRGSLDMTVYPADSSAEAVALYDFGDIYFQFDERRGFIMIEKYWMRIKILKESALDRASVSLRFSKGTGYATEGYISDIEGYTFNLVDNNIVTTKLDKKSIKTERLSNDQSVVKLNLLNVKKGSVIEYTYVVTTPLAAKLNPPTWSFQSSIPAKWSEFKIKFPNYIDYKMTMGGYLGMYISKSEPVNVSMGHSQFNGPGMSYRFVLKDVPAFNREPFITTASDYISRIEFELQSTAIPGQLKENYSRTWEQVDKTLQEASAFAGELRKNPIPRETRDELIKKGGDSTGKMNAAYTFIQSAMKWNEGGGISSESVKKAWENKKGSAGDINLILTSLLRDLGLDADPVILSTRSNGRVFAHLPSLGAFNYVVSRVQIGPNEYFLDASQNFAKMGMLPEHALNGIGRVIPKNGSGYFVEIKPRDPKTTLEMIDADLKPEDGILKGTYGLSLGGYDALSWRERHATETGDAYAEILKKAFTEWKISNISVTNKSENLAGVVNIKCAFELENESSSPDILYFNPIMAGRLTENPLKSRERLFPLDLATGISASFIGTFRLPDGYVLEELPKPELITLPERAGRFIYQVKQTGNTIQVNSSYVVNKLMFLPDDYGNLREFFERIVQKHAQPLIIKKK
jgi:hypothetical protein